MADPKRETPSWLKDPPNPRHTHFYFEAGEGVTLSPAAKTALETLSKELMQKEADVLSGQETAMAGGKCDICKGDCVDYSNKPCLTFEVCKICDSDCAKML